MRSILQLLRFLVLAVAFASAAPAALAAAGGRDASSVRRAEETVEQLRADLARVNAEVARLKGGDRSLRNDYRLRERMADAEALAQKLTRAEANLRALKGENGRAPGGAPVVASPQALPQDGSFELEAKADLLADQAHKLDGEAARLAKAADELRSRRALRRKAGNWERDPFAGLEASKRNVAAVASSVQKTAGTTTGSSSDSTRGTANPPGASTTASLDGNGAAPTYAPVVAPPATTAGTLETTGKSGVSSSASDGTAAAKSSPLVQSGFADRQALEQRLYLDPTTAAQLRQALGAGGGALDPDALERGAAALRARARILAAQAKALRAKSQAP
jgi:hypothetical protein